MSETIGYVIVTYNQASRQPRVDYGGEVYDSEADAREDALALEREVRTIGRQERVVVAELVEA